MSHPDKKKIIILYADAGFGHRSAAIAIQQALQISHPDDCIVELINPLEDERAPNLLRESQSDYDRILKTMPELYRVGYEASDASLPVALMDGAFILMLYDVMHDLVKDHEPDAIVTTYPAYQSPLDALFLVHNQRIPLLTVVTDLVSTHRTWFNRGVDLCMVPTEEVKQLALNALLSEEQIKITGIPVSPAFSLGSVSRQEVLMDLGLSPDLYTLLVLGSKRIDGMPEILNGINHSALPVQLILVAGGDDDLYQRFQKVRWHVPVKVLNFVQNVPQLMRVSDMLIGKAGGLAVSEALASGKPMALVNVLPGQEAGNAQYVVEHGAGELARDAIQLLEICHHWLQNEGAELKRKSEIASQIGFPDAAFLVANEAWLAACQPPETGSIAHLFERSHILKMLKKYRDDLNKINLIPAVDEINKYLPTINFEDKIIIKKNDEQHH